MPLDSRFEIVCPDIGTYVPNTWSKLRFSPMTTTTCLIGVCVTPAAARYRGIAIGLPSRTQRAMVALHDFTRGRVTTGCTALTPEHTPVPGGRARAVPGGGRGRKGRELRVTSPMGVYPIYALSTLRSRPRLLLHRGPHDHSARIARQPRTLERALHERRDAHAVDLAALLRLGEQHAQRSVDDQDDLHRPLLSSVATSRGHRDG